jgi:anti-sigma regulatory factor (Ser/Thr protein kinase)
VSRPDVDATATVTLRLPPSAAHVRTARLVAAAMARRCGVSEESLDEVRLAVGEACARAVRRHSRHSLREPVTVEFLDGDRFVVTVIDVAPIAAQSSVDTGDGVSTTKPGEVRADFEGWTDPTAEALGLALLAAVVHDLEVVEQPDGVGTRLTMRWPVEA